MQYISGKPSLRFKVILAKNNKHPTVFALNEDRGCFFFSARYALAAAVEALGLNPGDKLLVPSYNCGAEIDPLLYFHIKPVFYKINKDLSLDFDDLIKKINGTVKGILLTHFLGFPQLIDEIKRICDERDLFLIEDCAHAFLSAHDGKPLGSYGDVSIFSLLKTLPVPNGGVLKINNRNIKYNRLPKNPNLFLTLFYATELLRQKTKEGTHIINESILSILYRGLYLSMVFVRLMLAGFRKYFNPKGVYPVRPDSYLFVENLRSWGMSGLSKRIINRTNFEGIKIIRRRNFEYLLNYFSKNERGILPFRDLPSGVCPLFFPIILESGEQRERLYRTLKKRGITTHPWWDRFHPEVPWDEFPDAVYLKERLFGLPIHQDISIEQIERVIEEFEKAYLSKQR